MALVEAASVATAAVAVAAFAHNAFKGWIALERERIREMADGRARETRMERLEGRMDVHEGALKASLGEIHARFVDHEERLAKVTTEAATAVAGTMDAMSHVPTWGR